jgi:nucleoid DNA-binding protein
VLASGQMKKSALVKDIAKRRSLKAGDAADEIDRVITHIIRTLKRGYPAHLPGLGTITPGKQWTFQQEKNEP